MKLVLVMMLFAFTAAAPKVEIQSAVDIRALIETEEGKSWVLEQAVNQLIRQLIAYIRRIINEGSPSFGIPPLDPLEFEYFHVYIPAGLINLELELHKIFATGMGTFVTNKSRLELSDLSFDLDVTVPTFDISAEHYDLVGDLFTAIPIYGKGGAIFKVERFSFQAKVFLLQSEDGKSVLVDRIENADFQVPSFKSGITGAIGGGDIDAIVNAIIEDVIVGYVNRFRGIIASTFAKNLPKILNPILNELDTWKYIDLLPTPRKTT